MFSGARAAAEAHRHPRPLRETPQCCVYTSRLMGGRASGQVNSIMLTSELARRNDTVVVVVAVLAVGVEGKK